MTIFPSPPLPLVRSGIPQPWDRLPKEKSLSYSRFRLYLDFGPSRTIHRLYLMLTDTGQSIAERSLLRVCAKWHWVARAAAWDNYMAAVRERAFEAEAEEMGRLQARAGRMLFEKGVERISGAETAKLTIRDAIQLVVEGMKAERLARGEATSRVDMKVVNEVVERVARRLGRPVVEVMAEVEGLVRELPGGY